MNKRERRRRRLETAEKRLVEMEADLGEADLGEPAPDEPPAVTLDEALGEVSDDGG